MSFIQDLWEQLREKAFRSSFSAAEVDIGIPSQVRALMRERGWTQVELAERAGMKQPQISNLIKARSHLTIRTLLRLANAFDCALAVRFVPFSELAYWTERYAPERFSVPTFDNDTILDPATIGACSPYLVRPESQSYRDRIATQIALTDEVPAPRKPMTAEQTAYHFKAHTDSVRSIDHCTLVG